MGLLEYAMLAIATVMNVMAQEMEIVILARRMELMKVFTWQTKVPVI